MNFNLIKIREYFINILIFIFIAFSFLTLISNTISDKHLFSLMPKLNFGLDISGGTRITVKTDFYAFYKEKYENKKEELEKLLWKEDIEFQELNLNQNGISLQFKNEKDINNFKKIKIEQIDKDLNFRCEQNLTCNLSYQNKDQKEKDIISRLIPILLKRIDNLGLRDISIVRYDKDKIIVSIPKDLDIEKIKNIITKTAKLTFHLVKDNYKEDSETIFLKMKEKEDFTIPLIKKSVMSGNLIEDARPVSDENGNSVFFQLNNTGKKIFSEITSKNKGKHLAIVMDGKIFSAPMINSTINNGSCIISGKFSPEETTELAILLKSGSIETDLKIIEEKEISYNISESLKNSIYLSIISAFFIISFVMLFRYKFFGVISILCLFVNIICTIFITALFKITVSIPGLISFVLMLGIVIDANILTFEKIKEFKTLKLDRILLKKSFNEVNSTILDSNLTTIFASVALIVNGFGFVKSFGILLIIGIINSFFTNVYLTKKIILYIENTRLRKFIYAV